MRVLHITADFPDPLVPAKTGAISALLAAVAEHDHRVYSLNRVGWRHDVAALTFGPGHRAVTYGAPAYGLMLASRLDRVARFVIDDASGFQPDVVHAHKLSTDALVGEGVAAALGAPLVVSAQGNSDLKILGVRRDLLPRWRRIWHQASVVLPFAPWTRDRLAALLGARTGAVQLLPCILRDDAIQPPVLSDRPLVRTAFHLRDYKNKNVLALMEAVLKLAARTPGLRLEIAGGGDAAAFARLAAAAGRGGTSQVRLVGPLSASEISRFFNQASCMALPSLKESFGMVFVEALNSGCPVLLPRGFAIDGYLPEGEVSVSVPASDRRALAAGLERLLREEAAFKARLRKLQSDGGLNVFRRHSIAAAYRRALALAAASVAHAPRGG